MTMPQDVKATAGERSKDELRAAMYRILDELVVARSDRASALKKEFDELWKKVPGNEPTVH
jgi:hypothetical protein